MPLKIVFFGTPEFAVPPLEKLLETPHQVVAVVTQSDKPAGRGRKLTPPAVKTLAEARGLPVLQPASVRTEEFAAQMEALGADVAVVVAYGKILPPRVLAAPRHGCLNIHGSLLPAYRGAGPLQWAIVRGETRTGITIMQMDAGMDTGPMIATREVEILEDDTTVSLGHMLSFVGAELIVEVLAQLDRDGRLTSTPQDESLASYAPMIKREDARLDWGKSHESLVCAVRGFLPWPRAFTTLNNEELKITGAERVAPEWVPEASFDPRVQPGTVVDVFKSRGFVVRAGDDRGLVLVTSVQPPGKAEMGAYDFVNGGGLRVGTVLGR